MVIAERNLAGLEMPWEVLSAMIHGVSPVDLLTMPLRTEEEAYAFVLNYGYDLHHPDDVEEMRSFCREAVAFINNHLLGDETRQQLWAELGEPPSPLTAVPPFLANCEDVAQLLLTAAQGVEPERSWACSILKVMHAVAHMYNGPYYQQLDVARTQILKRFEDILSRDEEGGYILRSESCSSLPLYNFEAKSAKSPESTLVKLLCKKEMMAREVSDMLGVRLITHTPAEAILAIQILHQEKVLLFPNVMPSRSRNSLIDFEKFRVAYDSILEEMKAGTKNYQDLQQFFQEFKDIPAEGSFQEHNPASSADYRSIHITGRQLIRTILPDYQTEMRFFMPYEIQILDKQSYFDSRHGSSAHQRYKHKQLSAARRRVLGKLLQP